MDFLTFNSREIATAFWLVALLLWSLSQQSIREAGWRVVTTALNPKLLIPTLLMALYTALIVIGLGELNLWSLDLLKDTVYWFFGSALIAASAFATNKNEKRGLRDFVVDNLKLIILIEFLVNTYTFPFVVELFLIPFMALVAMLGVAAEYREDGGPVVKLAKGIQATFGLGVLVFAIFTAVSDTSTLGSWTTGRAVLLPFLLSLTFIPAMHALSLYATYELLFMRLQMGRDKTRHVKAYARWRMVLMFGLNRKKLLGFLRSDARKLMQVETKEDVDRVLSGMPEIVSLS